MSSMSLRSWLLSALLHALALALLPPLEGIDPPRRSPTLVRVDLVGFDRIVPSASLSTSAGGGVVGDLRLKFKPRRAEEVRSAQGSPSKAPAPKDEAKPGAQRPVGLESPLGARGEEGVLDLPAGGRGDDPSGAFAPSGGHGEGASGGAAEVLDLRPVVAPLPEYPLQSRRLRREGEVLLKVLVLADGRVGKVEVERSSGFEELDRSAVRAVLNWLFSPPGREVWASLPVVFRLR